MNIAQHVLELLKEHKEIALGGTGVFFNVFSSASRDSNGIFLPPTSYIDFRAEDTSDVVLLNYISNVENVDQGTARQLIDRYSASIQNSLINTGSADIRPLGILKADAESYRLMDNASDNRYFGLEPLRDLAFVPVKEPAIADVVAGDEVNYEPVVRGRLPWTIIVTALFIIISLAYFLYPHLFDLKSDRPIQVVHESKTVAAAPVASIDTSGSDTSGVVTAVNEVSVDTAPSASEVSYEVIVASFRSETEANSYLAILKQKGKPAKVIANNRKTSFKVSLGSYKNYDKANEAKRIVQQSFNKEAWILTVNNKK